MEWLQTILDNSTTPPLTAFVLGLLTSFAPCPLATNIAAIGYMGKEMESRRTVFRNGLLYTLGRTLSYMLPGIVLTAVISSGAGIFGIERAVNKWGELLAGPLLMLIGIFMLFGDKLSLKTFGIKNDTAQRFASKGGIGAFAIGMLFALTFCPASGVIYFGMLIPLSATTAHGYLLPVIYAVATSLPVIAASWILAFGMERIGNFFGRAKAVHKVMNTVVGLLFIAVGTYYCVEIYL